ncbi:ubiquitin carboxyl-terminal hydrolase 14 [Stachybotrys elegans]|uniref:Ubiquitin carboxyl-terminal hydrolase n=1 Tax=Stachybotrys elegans TaxID=80388 RepID=A0A8K0SH19_9HYPO|nr:ubiquitin carboxyl-terminal hydrolase 14 [Stachybotrys elegans]
MASIQVFVKHHGKKYEVEVDPDTKGEDFKLQLFSLTNVEPDRQRILIKGGQLKDDADMGKIGLKPGQNILMMGTPSDSAGANIDALRPKEQIKFVEDMTDAERAKQLDATPAGLINLGNTCYLNASLQTLRAIPELHSVLSTYKGETRAMTSAGTATLSTDLAAHLAKLFRELGETEKAFPPSGFIHGLRQLYPQFAERNKSGSGFAQQDAEEAWTQIVQQLSQRLRLKDSDESDSSFVQKYMAGEFSSVMECDEQEARDAGEEVVKSKDTFFKLDCHIDGQTNHLRDGIMASLTEKLEKKSEVLGRDATYTKKSQISRAPKYLTVHFVRFFWKRETQKKAKIMRKVTFPHELDIVEFCSDDLKSALVPVRDKVREVRKEEEDIERARKRRKKTHGQDTADIPGGSGLPSESEKKKKEEEKKKKEEERGEKSTDGDTVMGETYKTDAEVEAEKDASLLAAKKELNALINPELRKDDGANQSGLYELRAVVTHQGGSADSGHYTAFVKKTAPVDPKTGKAGEEDGKWWWFNDDKVTEVASDKIETLAGGGESHSALILLYKAIALPTAEGLMD